MFKLTFIYFFQEWVVKVILNAKISFNNQPDSLYWRIALDGNFSVKSAYSFLAQSELVVGNPVWQKLWRWQVPEKIKFFIWQVSHERLMTNSLRAKRGISNTSECPLGCHYEERVLHMLRDCERAKQIWKEFINPNLYTVFFSRDLQGWLWWNTSHQIGRVKFSQWPWQCVWLHLLANLEIQMSRRVRKPASVCNTSVTSLKGSYGTKLFMLKVAVTGLGALPGIVQSG